MQRGASAVLLTVAASAAIAGCIQMMTGAIGSREERVGAYLVLASVVGLPGLFVLARPTSRRWKAAALAVGLVLIANAALGGYHLWRSYSPPDIDRDGGAILTYEIDEEASPPDSYQLDELHAKVRKRVEQAGLAGIEVRSAGAGRVEVVIPRAGPEVIAFVKRMLSVQGHLELCILANGRDDRAAIEAARKALDVKNLSPELRNQLSRLEAKNEFPPPPRQANNVETFPCTLPDEPDHTYSWVELGRPMLNMLDLNVDQLEYFRALANDPDKERKAKEPFAEALRAAVTQGEKDRLGGEIYRITAGVERARTIDNLLGVGGGTFTPWGDDGNLYYVRKITNWDHRDEKERRLGKEAEFFALVRDPVQGQEITGDLLASVSGSLDERGDRTVDFSFNTEGGNRFHDLTTRNKPEPGPRELSFKRQIGIIFDDHLLSAPSLNEPIRSHGQIHGKFTREEVEALIFILRAGALPARLRPTPVSERTVAPNRW
jgi:SecD/SecF fusion protein